jgi:hypothetical protein
MQVVSVKVASVNITRPSNLVRIRAWSQFVDCLILKLARLLRTQPMHCVGSAGKITQPSIMNSRSSSNVLECGIFAHRRGP